MANETSREMSVLEISGADDTSTNIKLKIIDSITFVDPSENYQESVYRFENNASANRDVEIAEVGKDAPKLKVERIRKLNIVSPEEQGQKFFYELLTAPGAHRSTHTVKIYRWDEDRKEKDTSTWVKVERVDEIVFVDPANQYQETVYSLNWPDVDNELWLKMGDGA